MAVNYMSDLPSASGACNVRLMHRGNMARWMTRAMAAVLSTALLAGCGPGPSGEENNASTSSPGGAAQPDAEVFFPTMPEQNAVPTALTGGELVLDRKGCLKIVSGDYATVPIWPSSFEPDTSGNVVRILDGDRVVAQVGKRVSMGGGETSAKTLRGNDLMGERELRELSERCPDAYWFVGGGTRIVEEEPGSASASATPTPVPNVVGMEAEEACRTLQRAGSNAYVFGKRDAGGSTEPGQIVEQRPATPGPEVPPNTLLFVAKPFPDMLPKDTSCTARKVGAPG